MSTPLSEWRFISNGKCIFCFMQTERPTLCVFVLSCPQPQHAARTLCALHQGFTTSKTFSWWSLRRTTSTAPCDLERWGEPLLTLYLARPLRGASNETLITPATTPEPRRLCSCYTITTHKESISPCLAHSRWGGRRRAEDCGCGNKGIIRYMNLYIWMP